MNFTVTNSTATSVTASWTLDSSGFTDLQQMIVRWTRAPIELEPTVLLQHIISLDPDLYLSVFPPGNVVLTPFDVPVLNGQQFNQTFLNLEINSEYIVRIDGVNSAGTSVTLFAFETGEMLYYDNKAATML